jgi:hypothetical protein
LIGRCKPIAGDLDRPDYRDMAENEHRLGIRLLLRARNSGHRQSGPASLPLPVLQILKAFFGLTGVVTGLAGLLGPSRDRRGDGG